MLTFKDIEQQGLLIYRFISGSHCHGCATETSDVDEGGVYICPTDDVLGLGFGYQEQVSNETNDIVWYEIGKFMRLLVNSNPTMLEMLFIDPEFVLYKHPVMDEIIANRDMFITKRCFESFSKYAHSQIVKCQSSEKLFSNPTEVLKSPLDFCYTFYGQGSTKLVNWLDNRGLHQRFCGLVKIPNMHEGYGVYYDWKAHFNEFPPADGDIMSEYSRNRKDIQLFLTMYPGLTDDEIRHKYDSLEVLGYSGIVAEDGSSKSIRFIQEEHSEKHGVMLNSVAKGHFPICHISYNADGYAKHARDYARYQKWLKERNPVRYENNKGHRYDAKKRQRELQADEHGRRGRIRQGTARQQEGY